MLLTESFLQMTVSMGTILVAETEPVFDFLWLQLDA